MDMKPRFLCANLEDTTLSHVTIEVHSAWVMQKLNTTFIIHKGKALGKLTALRIILHTWFDHLEESFSY